MREDGEEYLVARLSASAERYEVFEDLVHEAYFLGVKDVLILTECGRDVFGKEDFPEVFEGLVFLRNDRYLLSRKTVRYSPLDILRHPSELVRFGLEYVLRHRSALPVVGIEGFNRTGEYISDGVRRTIHKRSRGIDNLGIRTVVGLQDNELGRGPAVAECLDILGIGSLELVDRLVIVPDCEHVRGVGHRQYIGDEPELCVIRILVLVHEHELVLFREIRADIPVLLDQADRSENHIREIDVPQSLHPLLVLYVDSCQ